MVCEWAVDAKKRFTLNSLGMGRLTSLKARRLVKRNILP